MDHSWHPRPIQGNNNSICPICSMSHFPFCPPHPHPSRFSAPSFEPARGPMSIDRPVYHDHPGHWDRNHKLPGQEGDYGNVNRSDGSDRGVYPNPHHGHVYGFRDGGYVGYECNNSYGSLSDDRSSKRLRVEGNVANPVVESGERRLRLGHDHGANVGFGNEGGVRGYVHERSGFEGQEFGNSCNVGVRGPSNVAMGNYAPNMGHGANYRREELVYRPAYEPGCGVKRNASDMGHGHVGNEVRFHGPQVGQYGQVTKTPEHGSFQHGEVGFVQPNYRNSIEPMPSNNAVGQYDQRNSMPTANQYSNSHPTLHTPVMQPCHMGYGPSDLGGMRPPPVEGYQGALGNQNTPMQPPSGPPRMDKQRGFVDSVSEHMGYLQTPQGFDTYPPLPASPPPPLPREPPPVHWSAVHKPAPVCSSAAVHSSYAPNTETQVQANPRQHIPAKHVSRGAVHEESQGMLTTFRQHTGGSERLPPKNILPDKRKTIDAAHLFKPPHRTLRPDHFVIILRGLPGSGKSYLAKMLRDLEKEHGGTAPRIHSMDDYFMTEVEKADDNDGSKSSVRGKKPKTKVVLEYCYEPEMEEAYRSSMLKAFRKTVEEGVFTFVIVDDRNLRVADFAQFWATAKRSGYEAYVLEAPYKDPVGCTARNVHGFLHDDVEKMAAQWEEAPSLYLQLDVKSLFHGDDLKESNIQEVDMDTEDGDLDVGLSNVVERLTEKTSSAGNFEHDEEDTDYLSNSTKIKDLGHSKWTENFDDDDHVRSVGLKSKANALSTLLGTCGKEGKSVHWGDQAGRTGFSIGAVKKANMASLFIGPGAGYNLKSNPLVEEDDMAGKSGETKKHTVFQERLRAERESFKAVFDRRRHRIGGVLHEDE